MKIGVPKEIKPQENRIGLTPESVKSLVSNGHDVLVENNGGFEARFDNNQYKVAGAKIVDKAEDIFNDEHLKKTNFFKKNQHPTEGDLLYPSFPVEFDEDRNEEPLHAPNLGENTKDILSDLGFSEFEIDNLASKGVIKIFIDES